jgi:prepilin-type N-terminal cleavage/methylation domain-containing protein
MKSTRHAYSVIELMTVISVLAILASMSTPGLVRSLRRGKVNDAVVAISQTCTQARQLARTHVSAPEHYGVTVVNSDGNTPGYVALTYGTEASPDTILMSHGKPVSKIEFDRGVVVMKDNSPLTLSDTESGWVFDYQTGHCMDDPIVPGSKPINITNLSTSTIDGRYARSIGIYRIGLVDIEEQ